MWKKVLAWCLSLMLILGCVCPVSVAEDGTSTSTDLCDHADTETVEDKHDGAYAGGDWYDATGHMIKVTVYDQVVCLKCGKILSTSEGRTQYEMRDHNYVDGSCTVCGRQECLHPNATVNSGWESSESVFVDKDYHATSGTWFEDVFCPDCNQAVSFTEVERTNVMEPHTFDENGVCSACGYKQPCQHTNTTTVMVSKPTENWWNANSGLQHFRTVAYYQQVVCQDCEAVLSETLDHTDTEAEDHAYEDGVCVKCGTPYCPHTSSTWGAFDREVTEIKIVDQTYHMISGKRYMVLWCDECGMELDGRIDPFTDEMEKHSLNSDGVCYECGYEATCDHANAYQTNDQWYVDFYSEDHAVPVPVDENTHRISGCHSWDIYCPDCDLVVDCDLIENDTAVSAHTFVDGVCSACGYAQPCQHTNTTTVMVSKPTEDWWNVNSGLQHFRSVDIYQQVVCVDCKAVLSETFDHSDYEAEDHIYENGACTVCGTPYCPHTTSSWGCFEREDTDIVIIDKTYHKVSGVRHMVLWCDECHLELDYRDDPFTEEVEKHSLSSEGKCYYCDYQTTCDHANAYQTNDEWFVDNVSFDDAVPVYEDENTHRISGWHGWDIYCPDCELVVDWGYNENDTAVEPHNLEVGTCVDCGYVACDHPDAYIISGWETIGECTPVDDTWHIVSSGTWFEDLYCPVCEVVISSTTEDLTNVQEKHTFDEEGLCSRCGLKVCLHASTTSLEYCEDTDEVYQYDADKHRVVMDVYTKTTCNSCSEVLSDVKTGQTDDYRPHTMVDGICTACGYACPHSGTETQYRQVPGDTWYSSLDGAHHYREIRVNEETVCLDCAKVLASTFDHLEYDQEDHVFKNDVCVKCGDLYCPHTNASWYYDWITVNSVTVVDQTYHIVNEGVAEHTQYCPDCGFMLASEDVTRTDVKEKHYLSDSGVCYTCGYETTCEHAHVSQINDHWAYDIDDVQPPVITVVDETSHRIEGYHWWTNECQDCGLVIGYDEQENDAALYPHDMVDGVCTICGYKAPVPTATPTAVPTATPTAVPTVVPTAVPTAEPTPTPTPKPATKPVVIPTAVPTAEPTAEPTPLPEVIVVENAPVQQLDQLVAEVQTAQDEGVEVIIEVVGTEEVLTEEEYQQFSTISVSEQLVVTLASIGLQDAIDAAVQSLGIELSEGATNLITQVTERQAALSEEEQVVVKEKLAELFPTREVVVDGVSYTCYIIDLRIVVDGVERIEQYAISLDEEGQWVFIKLELE